MAKLVTTVALDLSLVKLLLSVMNILMFFYQNWRVLTSEHHHHTSSYSLAMPLYGSFFQKKLSKSEISEPVLTLNQSSFQSNATFVALNYSKALQFSLC